MAYQSWSVVFGEQPSASKWGILGTNDASFNDGTGITGLYKNLLTVDSNPYKFKAYRNAAYTPANATITKYPFDAESFDTNNNYDAATNYRYTCPVSGFYYFGGHMQSGTASSRLLLMLYKNGAEHHRLTDDIIPTGQETHGGSTIVQATAGDYFEFWYYVVNPSAANVGSVLHNSFEGFLISRT